ncbi:MAG TPA: TetR/AcrR family transcriptional regulator [Candidatus Acidoferrales bacterium]|nr:TetR/AcrR family transcriptional regulator [Candidatus Acidoferrales bacterium]
MARTQRREREKAVFREEVLAAARAVVLEEGFDALTMRKIADAVEYSPGTIYLYFESRDAIAFELCRRGFEELRAALSPAATIADPEKRLRELGRLYVQFGIERSETYRLIFMEDVKYASAIFAKRADDADSPGMQALGLLVATLEELRAANRLLSDATAQELAETIWAGVHGIVSLSITFTQVPESTPERLSQIMVDGILGGLIAPAARARSKRRT